VTAMTWADRLRALYRGNKLMEQGWNDVAARMDRWAENGYAGDWVDPQYEAVS
jgi:hypothetical protein